MAEFKSLPNTIKVIDDRTVTGIASVFGNVDEGLDRIWPGAFSRTISQRRTKFRHLWNHDFFSPPIASIDDIREVTRDDLPETVLQQAPEAVGGLQVTRTYFDTPRASEVLVGLKAGAINEMSIGLDAVKFDFAEVDGQRVREIREIRLYDTSDVLWGMNGATSAVKLSMPIDLLIKHLEFYLIDQKAGARHSAADIEKLNQIAILAIDLGATNVKVVDSDEDSADKTRLGAGKSVPPLTLDRMRLQLLEFENLARV